MAEKKARSSSRSTRRKEDEEATHQRSSGSEARRSDEEATHQGSSGSETRRSDEEATHQDGAVTRKNWAPPAQGLTVGELAEAKCAVLRAIQQETHKNELERLHIRCCVGKEIIHCLSGPVISGGIP